MRKTTVPIRKNVWASLFSPGLAGASTQGPYRAGGSPFLLKGGGVWNRVPLAVSSAIHFSTCCWISLRPFSIPFLRFLAFTHSVNAPIASIASTTKYAVVTARTPTAIRSFRKSKSHCHSLNTHIRNISPTAHSARERIRNQSRSSSLTLQIETHSIYALFAFSFRR